VPHESPTRRAFLIGLGSILGGSIAGGIAGGLLSPGAALARDSLPTSMQAEFLAKVAKYDRNFETRAGSLARVRILQRKGSGASEAAAGAFRQALKDVGSLAGVPLEASITDFSKAADLPAMVAGEGLCVLYVMPGLDDVLSAIASALQGIPILTVGADADDVPGGLALGFAQVEGKPKIVINLDVARAQQVDFSSSILKISDVV
jgi:hypothetical protein